RIGVIDIALLGIGEAIAIGIEIAENVITEAETECGKDVLRMTGSGIRIGKIVEIIGAGKMEQAFAVEDGIIVQIHFESKSEDGTGNVLAVNTGAVIRQRELLIEIARLEI